MAWTEPVDQDPGFTVGAAEWNLDQANLSALYDEVNRLYLPAMAWDTTDTLITKIGVASRGVHWLFPNDGSTRDLYCVVPKPADWDAGTVRIRFHVAADGINGGNFRVRTSVSGVDPSNQELNNATLIIDNERTVTGVSVQWQPTEHTSVGGVSMNDGDKILLMKFRRISGDAADTSTDSMTFSGLELTYIPD